MPTYPSAGAIQLWGWNTETEKWVPVTITPEGKLKLEEVEVAFPTLLRVVRTGAGLLSSGVLSADKAIKEAAGAVYWLTVSDTAALAIELNDSIDDSGDDLWGFDLPADGYAHFIFDPPIEFDTGIWLDVSTATCKVTVGYL